MTRGELVIVAAGILLATVVVSCAGARASSQPRCHESAVVPSTASSGIGSAIRCEVPA